MSTVPATVSVTVPASGFVDDRFLAENTPYTRSWFQHARLRGNGPAFYRFGRRTLYKWSEVAAWIEANATRVEGGKP